MTDTAQIALAEEPPVLDTYSLVYSFVLMFLLPGVVLLNRLPWGDDRSGTYTLPYVSLVTVPFLLGILLTFLTDSDDGARKIAIRFLVLTPLILLTGVTIMFLTSIVMVPASRLVGIKEQGLFSFWWVSFFIVAAPLVWALIKRVRGPFSLKRALQVGVLLLSLGLVIGLTYVTLMTDITLIEVVRKDIVIYVVGAMSWYGPSFGLAAGIWRRSGLV